jgi:hypothetical protein
LEIKISSEELRKRRLFLGLPCYGGNCSAVFARSIADLTAACTHYGITVQMYFLMNESLIQRARNYICDEFMRSEATHLMFIDSDIGFNPQDVIAMLALSSEDSEYDVLCGPYPKKCISWEKIKVAVDKGFADENPNNLDKFVGDYVFNPKGGKSEIKLSEPAEVLESGTGFMMIQRRVFEKFQQAYPQQAYRPDHVRTEHFDGTRMIFAYFDCVVDHSFDFGDTYKLLLELSDDNVNIEEIKAKAKNMLTQEKEASKRYLSEDYFFCQKIQKAGMKVWLLPWIQLTHIGSYMFGGSLIDIAQLGVTATADPEMLKKKVNG